jgi:ABC-type nitrate/sulfonate/bicarbonate transport system ATPase subunit
MIHASHCTFGHGAEPVVQDIDFRVEAAETLCVLGHSGSGKTTILKTIRGEVPLLSGTLLLDGETRDSAWTSRHVVRTLQSFPLLHWKTVRQNLLMAARIGGFHQADIDQVLTLFSAAHIADRYPRALSGGERCRASLAQAALSAPRILLLDEPFTGLDVAVKQEIARELFSFCERFRTAIVFVTHDILDAATYADRVMVLSRGRPCRVSCEIDTREDGAIARIQQAMMGSN